MKDTTLRDTIIAVALGSLILGFIVYGVMSMGAKQQVATVNTLSGKIVAKQFIPGPGEDINVGAKGLRAEKYAGEYLLQVRVESEQRTFDVPVDANTYQAVKVGDTQTFLRPRSEQKK